MRVQQAYVSVLKSSFISISAFLSCPLLPPLHLQFVQERRMQANNPFLICLMEDQGLRDQSEMKRLTIDLAIKLQALLRDIQSGTAKVSSSKILKETCNYIKRLHSEVDDLSERLSELMASVDTNTSEADILRSPLKKH